MTESIHVYTQDEILKHRAETDKLAADISDVRIIHCNL